MPEVVKFTTGEASWYGPGFYGKLTANGEVYRRGTMTAAHRTLPFGTKVRVTNLWNGRTAVIRINCLLYTSPSPRDRTRSRMPSSA